MNIEDTMGTEELRRELRRAWDTHHALMDALRELPEMPDPKVLSALSEGSPSDAGDWERGKRLQMTFGLNTIPPVSECERGAGLWSIVRDALHLVRARNK